MHQWSLYLCRVYRNNCQSHPSAMNDVPLSVQQLKCVVTAISSHSVHLLVGALFALGVAFCWQEIYSHIGRKCCRSHSEINKTYKGNTVGLGHPSFSAAAWKSGSCSAVYLLLIGPDVLTQIIVMKPKLNHISSAYCGDCHFSKHTKCHAQLFGNGLQITHMTAWKCT